MSARSRTFDSRIAKSGRRFYAGTWTVKVQLDGESGSCDDVVDNWEFANPLKVVRQSRTFPILNGQYYYPGSTLNRAFENYPCDRVKAPEDPSVYWGNPNLNAIAVNLYSRTNPGSAHVSVPQVIAEMKDLPDLVQGWGRKLLQLIAKGWITWQFAVKPMVSDIRKLLDFQAAVSKRFKYLERLREGQSVKRKVWHDYGYAEEIAGTRQYLQSIVATVTARMKTTYTSLSWSTCRWKLDVGTSLPKTQRELWNLAQRLCSGVTSYESLQLLWELIPWSWFVDWFAEVGTFIRANNNSIPAHPCLACHMRTSTARTTYDEIAMPTWNYPGTGYLRLDKLPEEFQVIKERWVLPTLGSLLPPTNCPLLSERQWSILLALRCLNDSWLGSKEVPLFSPKVRRLLRSR